MFGTVPERKINKADEVLVDRNLCLPEVPAESINLNDLINLG